MARTESRSAPGPENRANRSAIDRARGRIARRLVAPRQLADDDGRGARQQAGLAQLRHHAIEPVRPLADFVEEQHVARAAGRTRTACRATRAAASACRRAAGPRLRRRACVSSPAARARPPARARQQRADERLLVVAAAPRAEPAREHRPVKRHHAAAEREERQQRGDVAVADERLRARAAPRRDRAAAAAARCRSRRGRRSAPAIDGSRHAA